MSEAKQQSTRERLLGAAMALFADRGFEATTVASICERAVANIAAVNYHFGDKQALYLEALRAAYLEANRAFPVVNEDAQASPEQCLRHHIVAMIAQIFCDTGAGCFSRMAAREFAEPTFAVNTLFSELIGQNRVHMSAAVRGILGPQVSDEKLHLGMVSVVAQFQFYNFTRMIRESVDGPIVRLPDADKIAAHIYQFSIAGLMAMKAEGAQS